MLSFKQYMEDQSAAPSTGMGQPADPDKQSNDDLNVLRRELDISPEDMEKALQVPILSFSPINQDGEDQDSGPQVIFPDKVNKSGSVDGRIMPGNMQKRPNGSKSHASSAMRPLHLRGTKNPYSNLSLSNIWLEPLRAQQQMAAGGMGGGMPGMGGGMPGGIPPTPGGI